MYLQEANFSSNDRLKLQEDSERRTNVLDRHYDYHGYLEVPRLAPSVTSCFNPFSHLTFYFFLSSLCFATDLVFQRWARLSRLFFSKMQASNNNAKIIKILTKIKQTENTGSRFKKAAL